MHLQGNTSETHLWMSAQEIRYISEPNCTQTVRESCCQTIRVQPQREASATLPSEVGKKNLRAVPRSDRSWQTFRYEIHYYRAVYAWSLPETMQTQHTENCRSGSRYCGLSQQPVSGTAMQSRQKAVSELPPSKCSIQFFLQYFSLTCFVSVIFLLFCFFFYCYSFPSSHTSHRH